MKQNILFLILILSIFLLIDDSELHAKEINIIWQKMYENFSSLRISCMIPTSDNGFILSGTINESKKNIDCWLMKFNHLGSIEWYNKFGSSVQNEFPYSCIQLKDKGYIICGAQKNPQGMKAWILKVDFRGTKIWEKTYGQGISEAAYNVCKTKNDDFVISGKQFVDDTQKDDAWIMLCDKNGDTVWETTYGGVFNDVLYSVVSTEDSGYAACGKRTFDVGRNADFWIIKLGKDGEFEWDRSFGGKGEDGAVEIFQINDLGYTFWGNMVDIETNKIDTWIVKLSKEGYIEWEKTIGGFGAEVASSIFHTQDDGFMICGESIFSSQFNSNFWTLKLNKDGDIEFDNEFVGQGKKMLGLVVQIKDGSYILAGFEESDISFNKKLFLLKFKRILNAEDSLYAQISDYVTSDYVGGMFLPLRREREYHFEPIIYITDYVNNIREEKNEPPIISTYKNKYFEKTYQYQIQSETRTLKEFNKAGIYREVPVIKYYGRYGALFPGLSTQYLNKYDNKYTERLFPRWTIRFEERISGYKEVYETKFKNENEIPTDIPSSRFSWRQTGSNSGNPFYATGSRYTPQPNPRKQKLATGISEYTISATTLVPMIFLWLVILAAIVMKILFSMRK
ncbi:MAG: hypothetical protein RAP70_10510 [Candidatus Celaenobacter antarcticus]|nr:hypothetical protein [Candidatus Celaenobacter antarcticus]